MHADTLTNLAGKEAGVD